MDCKILIVDDEPDIVSMLADFFGGKGCRILSAHNGAEALRKIEQAPDIILLDISLPDIDGLEVCELVRDRISCPILFLTARIEDADKVKGFSVGGDDYILKPFSLTELEARVCAHLRREVRHKTNAQLKFAGGLAIDYTQRQLFFGKKEIPLTKKEFDIVELLSQNQGQVFDKERIYEKIWGYNSEGDSGVVADISAESGRKLQRTQSVLILKRFGGAAINGAVKALSAQSVFAKDSRPLYFRCRRAGAGIVYIYLKAVRACGQKYIYVLPRNGGELLLPHQ